MSFEQNMEDIAPKSFKCPLTLCIMKKPYTGTDGNTYEYEEIKKWLAIHGTSPITRQVMTIDQLIYNRNLYDSIEEWVARYSTPKISLPKFHNSSQKFMDESVEINTLQSNDKILISINAPNITEKQGVDIYGLVDTSYSMGSEVETKSENGEIEVSDQSILDLAKHALKTVIHSMDEKDRLTLVPYSSLAYVNPACTLLPITESNKEIAINQVKSLRPNGQTNIWDAIIKTLDTIKSNNSGHSRKSFVLLFTDGIPNISPPRGEAEQLKRYFARNPELNNVIFYTFGFGYHIDNVIKSLASVGNGQYNYIPDASLLGSVLINSISNIFSTMITKSHLYVKLDVQNLNFAEPILGKYEYKIINNDEIDILIDQLNYGQSKDIIINLKKGDDIIHKNFDTIIKYDINASHQIRQQTHKEYTRDRYQSRVLNNILRLEAVKHLENISDFMGKNQVQNAQAELQNFIRDIESCDIEEKIFINELLADLNGQVSQSISRIDWWTKWGIHYLPSLICAYQSQLCNNFKDKLVQLFAGELFQLLQETGEQIFIQLPMDKGSIIRYHNSHSPSAVVIPATGDNYYNRNSGCFIGSCKALMADNTLKSLSEIQRGDYVKTPNNKSAKVIGIMKTKFNEETIDLVKFKNLVSTPYHPIQNDKGDWVFPSDLAPIIKMECKEVFTFALNKDHIMIIEDILCSCIGHNFTGPVISHPYFGSSKIIKDLEKFASWKLCGIVELYSTNFYRNKITNLIEKIKMN